jgi:hypothetical protein
MFSRAPAAAGAVALLVIVSLVVEAPSSAQSSDPPPSTMPAPQLVLRYHFRPDCLRQSLDGPCDTPKNNHRLDFGPQIAVWVENATGSFIDTLLVTNAVAVRGIGNRPGYWRFPSNWHFPYGKRKMALPVWAHARGRAYDTLIFQDDKEMALGFHESVSTIDPYYCLSFRDANWIYEVDAISCPSDVFNSSKGRFEPMQPRSYYPPRNDLTMFGPNDCDYTSMRSSTCPSSAQQFAALNDLDAVASATPAYGGAFTGTWVIPTDLPEGAYVLAVEVNKEFDQNPFHTYEAYQDPQLPDKALRNNIGQPSVVWKLPFMIDRVHPQQQGTATDIAGYGDWDGETGTLHAPDSTISQTPGSGLARLMVFARPSIAGGDPVQGRVHLNTEIVLTPQECLALPADNGRITNLEVPEATITDRDAVAEFVEAGDRGKPVQQYEIRYMVGEAMTLEAFRQATPATSVVPEAPGVRRTVKITELKSNIIYTVGMRVRGGCVNEGPLVTATFKTKPPVFKQLSGCFVATAAYGSALEPQVQSLRRLRDHARARSAWASVPLSLYERASPPVAGLLRQSEVTRALVREALAPLVGIADDAAPLLR